MSVFRSTAYLPSLSYISGCLIDEEVLIEKYETFPKQTCRNRCYIYGPNGLQILSIPVVKINGSHTLTKDIRIASSVPWQRLHWRSIETAYNNSPFFLFYQDEFEKIFRKKFDFLLDLNTQFLEIVFSILSIEKKIRFTDHLMGIPACGDPYKKYPGENKTLPIHNFIPYTQVFSMKHGFLPDLSIIDLIFNLGPGSGDFLV